MKGHYINWHQHFTHPKAGRGKEFPWILKIAKTTKKGRILDWGCGKGGTADYIERETGKQVSRYDPGYKPYSIKPEGCFELVYSTDVFEHIEEEDLDSSKAPTKVLKKLEVQADRNHVSLHGLLHGSLQSSHHAQIQSKSLLPGCQILLSPVVPFC